MEPEGSLPHSQASATCPILGQPNPVQIPTSYFLEIHRNIIHPSTNKSPSGLFPPVSPPRPSTPPLLTHTRHMPSPSHSSPFYHHFADIKFSHKSRFFLLHCTALHFTSLIDDFHFILLLFSTLLDDFQHTLSSFNSPRLYFPYPLFKNNWFAMESA